MAHRRIPTLLLTGALSLAAAWGQPGEKQLFQVTATQQAPFQPGGVIHLNRSFGYLSVEGWDRPEVELTVIKTLDSLYAAKDQAEATRRVDNVKVTVDRKSDTDLEIDTVLPRHSHLTHPFGFDAGVMLNYQLHVPRNSKLVIHHGTGDVIVTNMTSDIEATGHMGDIVLLLPETEKYAIDAKSKIGTVLSDFDGAPRRRDVVGEQYALAGSAPSHRIYLRMGVGGITIKQSPASAQEVVGPAKP